MFVRRSMIRRSHSATRRGGRFSADRVGATLVEFAIAANVLFMFVMGMLEFSRAYGIRHALRQACYEGCRTGCTPGATVAEVRSTAQGYLDLVGVVNPTVTVTPTVIDSNTTEVTVSIAATFRDSSWFTPMFLGSAVIRSTTTLQHENALFPD
jgi:Flp pilus assembly protein TadG